MASTSPFPWPISRDIQIIVIVPSALSFIATAISSYWFFGLLNTERNFRRTLVLILILADCSKSFWLMVFNAVGLATSSHITSSSAFCQAGGFLLQFSIEACDLAIVFLITHVSIQILPPWRFWPKCNDGLWPVRNWILASCLLVPLIDASIPFSRLPEHNAYNYDGIYCSLNGAPLWMPLVLSWVPRYIFWLYLLITLIRLYLYIRSQSFARHRGSVCSTMSETPSSILQSTVAANGFGVDEAGVKVRVPVPSYLPTSGQERTLTSPDESERKQVQNDRFKVNGSATAKKRQEDARQQRDSITSFGSVGSATTRPRKQFRAVSLYPFFYILTWSVPFTVQCISFGTTRGVNGIWALRASGVACVASLGIIDAVIFCSMEKPWRYSLNLLRSCTWSPRYGTKQTDSVKGSTLVDDEHHTPVSLRRPHGGGSDRHRQRTLEAYERLAMEQAERISRPQAKRATPSHDIALRCPAHLVDLGSPEEPGMVGQQSAHTVAEDDDAP